MIEKVTLAFFGGFLYASLVSFADTLAERTYYLWFSRERKKITSKWKKLFEGRSRCEHCHGYIKAIYLIPILGYFLSRARCRHCQWPIPIRHVVMEGVFFFYGAWLFATSQNHISQLIFALALPSLAIIWLTDRLFFLIPDLALLYLLFLGILDFSLRGDVFAMDHKKLLTLRATLDLSASIFWFLLFHLIRLLSGKKLGYADATLTLALSLLLGFSRALLLPTLAALLAILNYFLKHTGKKENRRIPFAPYLIMSTFFLKMVPERLLLKFFS
ncbi:MAG: prepilin peptidase [Leptospiraceae bacterium]|nr:prepilin peptidase [Leptospiraceae bacterium]MDW8305940.1 prepilin peptidase [Leptospiraceae bacterium]